MLRVSPLQQFASHVLSKYSTMTRGPSFTRVITVSNTQAETFVQTVTQTRPILFDIFWATNAQQAMRERVADQRAAEDRVADQAERFKQESEN